MIENGDGNILLCPVYMLVLLLLCVCCVYSLGSWRMQVKLEDYAEDAGPDADARDSRGAAVDLLPGSVHASLKEEVICSLTISACRVWFLS